MNADANMAPRKRLERDLSSEQIEHDLIAYLKEAGGSATKSEVYRNVGGRGSDRDLVIADLVSRGVVEARTLHRGVRGRPPIMISLLQS